VQFSGELFNLLAGTFITSLLANLIITLVGKFAMPFASEVAMLASREISHGKYRNHFWWGGVALGHVIPLVLFIAASTVAMPVAVLSVIVGLFFYEYAFVMAPQHIPNS
jgi:hypothetical protein